MAVQAYDDGYKSMMTHNDYDTFQNIMQPGQWEQLSNPVINDIIRIPKPLVIADTPFGVELPEGFQGQILQFDEDGAAKVLFPELLTEMYSNFPWWFAVKWIDARDLSKLQRRCK